MPPLSGGLGRDRTAEQASIETRASEPDGQRPKAPKASAAPRRPRPRPGRPGSTWTRCGSGCRTKKGPEFWRSLDELAETPEFEDAAAPRVPAPRLGVARAASRAAASCSSRAPRWPWPGLTGCTKQPSRRSSPTSGSPSSSIPGKPLFFATALTLGGYATGVARREPPGPADQDRGQPGPPGEPRRDRRLRAGRRARRSTIPDRSQAILAQRPRPAPGAASSARSARPARAAAARRRRAAHPHRHGHLADPRGADPATSSPRFPQARWHRWEPAGRTSARAGAAARLRRGRSTTRYDFTKAEVILTLDADVLCRRPGAASATPATSPRGRRRARRPAER